MLLNLDWAVYGYRPSGGHGWLRGSLGSANLSTKDNGILARFTDLSPHYAEQPSWTPYLAGRPIGERYFFTFTTPMPKAKRKGTVTTRVFAAPCGLIGQVRDLRPLLSELRESGVFDGEGRRPFKIPLDDEANLPLSATNEGAEVAATFVKARGRRIIFPSVDLWHERLPALWAVLWPEARASLSFRPYVEPQVLPDERDVPDVVIVPKLSPVWQAQALRYQTFTLINSTSALPIIAGLTGAASLEANAFASAMCGSVRDLHRAHVVESALARFRLDGKLHDVAYALRFLSDVPLRQSFQTALEAQLRQTVVQLIPDVGAEEVSSLQQLPESTELSEALTRWTNQRLQLNEDVLDALIIVNADSEGWFDQAVRMGVTRLQPGVPLAQRFLSWWQGRQNVRWIFEALTAEWDSVLAEAAASIEASDAHELRTIARECQLWQLNAVLAVREDLSELDAVVAQTPLPKQLTALKAAHKAVGSAAFLDWSVASSSETAYVVGAECLASDPSLLANLNVSNPGWLEVWAKAMPELSEPLVGIPEPTTVTRDLLDAVMKSEPVPEILLQSISQTAEANLLGYERLEEAWDVLPEGFHSATATAYLKSSDDPGSTFPQFLEAIRLQISNSRVSSPAARRLLTDHGRALDSKELALLINVFGEDVPPDILGVIKALPQWQSGNQRDNTLAQLDNLVQWNFRWFFSPVKRMELASKLDRKVDQETWWSAFPHIAAQVADAGPKHIWVRSGGDPKHLLRSGTILDQWTDATRLIQTCGNDMLYKVLVELKESRPDNRNLQAMLATLPEGV